MRYENAHASAAYPFDGLLFLQNETNSYAFCSCYCIVTQLGWYLQNAVLYKTRPKYSRVNEMNKERGLVMAVDTDTQWATREEVQV